MEWVFAREWTPEPMIRVLALYITNIGIKDEHLHIADACIDDDGDWYLEAEILDNENWDKKIEVIAWTICPDLEKDFFKMRLQYKKMRRREEDRKAKNIR